MQPSGSMPGRHPPPPEDLAQRSLPIRVTSQSWLRLHDGRYPAIYWGLNPPRPRPYRFDAPSREYGVLYAGADEQCAFIETFGYLTGIRRVSIADLRSRLLSRIDVARPLNIVDLTGARLPQLGADARLFAGEFDVAQEWALAFFHHPSAPDGIYYHSRHDPERMCAALFDRVEPALAVSTLGTLADQTHELLLQTILSAYHFGFGRS